VSENKHKGLFLIVGIIMEPTAHHITPGLVYAWDADEAREMHTKFMLSKHSGATIHSMKVDPIKEDFILEVANEIMTRRRLEQFRSTTPNA
jgi:hypothetical protein